jgi:hypothetical protein
MLKGDARRRRGGLASGALVATVLGGVGVIAALPGAGGCYLWARHGFGSAVARYRGRVAELADALAERASEVAGSGVR